MRTPFLITAIALTTACGTADEAPGILTRTGAALSVDYFAETDVQGFHFEITRVACPGESADFEPFSHEENVDLTDGVFPGMVQHVEATLDANSRHVAADFFLSLEPGCYDVLAVPASFVDGPEWAPSADCSVAELSSVEVYPGETTKTDPLISQCVGDPLGSMDVMVLLNHPPQVSLEIESTTNYECEPVTVCATVEDVDDDPILVEFIDESLHGWFAFEAHEPEIVGFEAGHRIWEVCADIVTRYTADYDVSVKAYDLAILDGEPVPLEDLVVGESHAAMSFLLHTNWAEEPMCLDDGELVSVEGVEIERYPGCDYIDAEEFYCSGSYPVDPDVAQFLCDDDGSLIEEALYPECTE